MRTNRSLPELQGNKRIFCSYRNVGTDNKESRFDFEALDVFRSAMGRLLKRKTSAKRKHAPGRSRGKQGGNLSSSSDDKLKNNKSAAVDQGAADVKKISEERKKSVFDRDRGGKNKPSGISRSVSPHKKKLPSTEGYVGRSLQFLREVRAELKKVTWPSRKQTTGSTVVVIILVMIISFFLGLVDLGLSGLIRMVLR